MKLSVSVPDALWETARSLRPELNPSHLVQVALESWSTPRETPGFSLERPAGVDAAFAAARDRIASQARDRFAQGYRAAVVAANELEWWTVEALANGRFDVREWANGIARTSVDAQVGNLPKDWGADPQTLRVLVEALGALVPPYGDDCFNPDAIYIRGFAQAMRDLWEEAVEGARADTHGRPSSAEQRSSSGNVEEAPLEQ